MLRRDQDDMVCTRIKYMVRMAKKRGDLVDLRGDVPNAGNTQKKYTSSYCRQESDRSLERERCVTAARTEL